jgi:uncharacterized protein YidB (DUF937 family)
MENCEMGLLDQVIGGLMGGAGGGGSPIQGVLMSMLGGDQQAGIASGGQDVDQGMRGTATGGLAGIISGFERAGLGHIVQSWIGDGPNQPVSPQQLQGVFGNDRVQTMAGEAGMAPHDFLSQLSQHLPNAVNGLTPNGRLPDEGTVSV